MTALIKAVAAILFLIAVVNAGHQTIHIYQKYHDLFPNEDSVSHANRVFEPARKALIKMGATHLSYRMEPGKTFAEKADEYYIVQYALAPIVIEALRGDSPWVLMNYSGMPQRFPATDLTCIEDFGWGLAIHKKNSAAPAAINETPDLGSVWHEQEGEWTGTWTRRGFSNIFDAVWKTADGRESKDEVVYESVNCQRLILFRKGTNGRYRGRLSADGSRIESGEADWFSTNDHWSATIDKSK